MIIETEYGPFDWVQGWGDLPAELAGHDVPGVAVGPSDHLYVLSRSSLPVVVLDRNGAFLSGWGEGDFVRPHGIHVAPDGSVWCADDEGQRLLHYSGTGQLIGAIEGPNRADETGYIVGDAHSVHRSADPFCYPTGIESGTEEDIWVTDGYGNARVHHFNSRGDLIGSFGNPGSGPLEFVIPHGVLRRPTGELLVSDRVNERLQVIDPRGVMVDSWPGLHFPNNIATIDHEVYYVAELGNFVQGLPHETTLVPDAPYARVTVRDSRGALLAEILPAPGSPRDTWFAPHGIAVDSHGDVYVGEVRSAYGRGLDTTGGPRLHKLVAAAR
jgi:DNA-binding beta-propeller fold protein YncE